MINRFALVTGASTGIGRAVAVGLGKRGFMVGLVARRKGKLEETLLRPKASEGQARGRFLFVI